jgi:hypothetical protein
LGELAIYSGDLISSKAPGRDNDTEPHQPFDEKEQQRCSSQNDDRDSISHAGRLSKAAATTSATALRTSGWLRRRRSQSTIHGLLQDLADASADWLPSPLATPCAAYASMNS